MRDTDYACTQYTYIDVYTLHRAYTCIHFCRLFKFRQHCTKLQKVGYYIILARCSSTQKRCFTITAGKSIYSMYSNIHALRFLFVLLYVEWFTFKILLVYTNIHVQPFVLVDMIFVGIGSRMVRA